MKTYVESTMQPDEREIYSARIHWAIYINPVCLGILGSISVMAWLNSGDAVKGGIACMFFLLAFIFWVDAFLTRNTTEIVITNKRVVAKSGFIRRETYEPQLSQTEGANLKQDLLGRLLGYGQVKVNGTGGGGAPITFVDDPVTFRNKLAGALSENVNPMGNFYQTIRSAKRGRL
jgi:uncharacterized membrane protein YdbT with pleckstrin-like domain